MACASRLHFFYIGLHGLAPLGPPGSVQGVAHAAGYGRLDVLVASGDVDEGAEAVSIERQRGSINSDPISINPSINPNLNRHPDRHGGNFPDTGPF
jgi:hypothetical protein